MKHRTSIMLLSALALASPRVFAATTTVLPGQSIQAAIDAATAGDMFIIKGGTYQQSININKNIDFRREQGSTVTLGGNVGFSGLAQRINFAHFNVTGNVTFTNSKVYLYDCNVTGNVTATSSDWTLQECEVSGDLTSNSSDTKVLRTTITGNLTHATTGDTNCTVFQSTVGEVLKTYAKRSWIGYNTIRSIKIYGGAMEAEIVGNDVNVREATFSPSTPVYADAVALSVKVRNNRLRHTKKYYTGHGVYLKKCGKALIANNEFIDIGDYGVHVHASFGGYATVTGNFFYKVQGSIINSPDVNVAFFNNYWEERDDITNGWVDGGVVKGTGNVKGDSGLPLANEVFDWTTIPVSLKDKGPDGLEFKDHNGTRNDIGPFGGHHFDPNGATSSTPVVLSADLAPMSVQKGVTTIVKVNSRAVVSTPKQ